MAKLEKMREKSIQREAAKLRKMTPEERDDYKQAQQDKIDALTGKLCWNDYER